MNINSLELKVFTKEDCPICQLDEFGNLLRKLSEHGTPIKYYNVDTTEGLAEAAYESIGNGKLPVILAFRDGERVGQWEGKIPLLEEVLGDD